ncbi:MAG: Helix-turn-helix domain [Acidimicrobiaceae bacterium]|nr:Helix-turn-helix domain [Acidimicrobiaceae bacterium]
MQDLLRTSDVAALFQVSTRTVSEWARRGRVPCMRTPGGQWRYPAEPIRRLVNQVEHSPWDELAPPMDGQTA